MASQAEDVTLVEHEELPATKPDDGTEDSTRTENTAAAGFSNDAEPSEPDLDARSAPMDSSTQESAASPSHPKPNNNATRTTPVYYHAKGGPKLSEETVVISANGHSMIVTPPDNDSESQPRPLCEKDLKFLKIFSIVAIVMFFPTGIAALVYALRARRFFVQGAERGDMAPARKQVKFCERLIIISLVLGLLTFVFVFAILEKTYANHQDMTYHHGYGH